jgi:proline iminopeptidase
MATKKSKLKKNKTVKNKDLYSHTDLYPPIKPLKTYKMKVSKLHTIAYYIYGNKQGKPVLFVHGGPGGGTTPDMARFFNPKKYYIVLVDQRGCGKSSPNGETRENNTTLLIEDFERIRKKLNIKNWMVFGGSWGSTLSLAYTLSHPDRVTELVLRGLFLCTKGEIDWLIEKRGAYLFNPDSWEYYIKNIPQKDRHNMLKAYEKCFKGKYGKDKIDKCLLAWSVWETSNSTLKNKNLDKIITEYKKNKNYIAMSKLENYYFLNNCFLDYDYFFRKDNLKKLENIPIKIIQGRYDLVTQFNTAHKLHKALPHSEFYVTVSGHSAFDDDTIKYLVKATDDFSNSSLSNTVLLNGGTKLERFEFNVKTFASPTNYLLIIADHQTGRIHRWSFDEDDPRVVLELIETEEDEEENDVPVITVDVRYIPETQELEVKKIDNCTIETCEKIYLGYSDLFDPQQYTLGNVKNVLDNVNARLHGVCPNLNIQLRNLQQHTGIITTYSPSTNYLTLCMYLAADCVASVQIMLRDTGGVFLSKTREDLEKRGINQLLRAVAILLAPHIYFEGKPLKNIDSLAANWKSAYVLLSKYECETDDMFTSYINELKKRNADVSITPEFIKKYYYKNQDEENFIEVRVPITQSNLTIANAEVEKMRINCVGI